MYYIKTSFKDNSVKKGKTDESIKQAKIATSIADEISTIFGFSPKTNVFIKGILYNDLTISKELIVRIETIISILKRYGYSSEEAINIIEDNKKLLLRNSSDLMLSLAIASQYDMDERVLLEDSIYNVLNTDVLYSITEELKSNGQVPNEENVIKLYYLLKRKENGLKDLSNKFPFDKKKRFVLSYIYDQNMRKFKKNVVLKK